MGDFEPEKADSSNSGDSSPQDIMRSLERTLSRSSGSRAERPASLLRAMLDCEAELLQVDDSAARFDIFVGGSRFELTARNTGEVEDGAAKYRLDELNSEARAALLAEASRRMKRSFESKDEEDFEIFCLVLNWLQNALGAVRQEIVVHA